MPSNLNKVNWEISKNTMITSEMHTVYKVLKMCEKHTENHPLFC